MLVKRLLRGLAVATAVGVVVGCGGKSATGSTNSGGDGTSAGASSQGVLVTKNKPKLPHGCKPRPMGRFAVTFTAALGEGDQSTLRHIWSGPFKWFSVNGPASARSIGPRLRGHPGFRGFTAHSPAEALDYVDPPRGFAMQLRELGIANTAREGGVDIEYVGVWHEETGDKSQRYGMQGKGFVNCGRGGGRTLRVWSMAVHPSPNVPSGPCGKSDRRRRLVVC